MTTYKTLSISTFLKNINACPVITNGAITTYDGSYMITGMLAYDEGKKMRKSNAIQVRKNFLAKNEIAIKVMLNKLGCGLFAKGFFEQA
jgi:hypothetical protein